MFHYFVGQIQKFGEKKILRNEFFGIEVYYLLKRGDGEFFLYPYFDTNSNSYTYYCFDSIEQKINFENIYKIPGIGPKTAYNISIIPIDNLKKAIKDFDIKFFQSIPGIGPKTAKRLVVELKNSISFDDIKKLDIDEKLLKDITKSLKNLGYETNKVKKLLLNCPVKLEKENTAEIIKWLISNFN